MKRLVLILPIIILLSACASSYPLGMNEEQWNKLSAEERQQLLLEQQKYREQQRLARIEAEARARELQHQEDMAEKARLQALYDNPVNGNVVMVNVLGGVLIQGKRTKRIQEETFQLARGEIQSIELIVKDNKKGYTSRKSFYLEYAINGNAVYLYLEDPQYNNYRDDRIALLRDGNWQCGSHYVKNLNSSYEKLKKVKLFVKESGSSCRHLRPRQPEPRKLYR